MTNYDEKSAEGLNYLPGSEGDTLSGVGGGEVKAGKKGVSRWIWFGCVLLVIAASMQSATLTIGGNDTWVAMACGRYQLGPWAMEDPGRTWQMKLLDKFGVHITWCDPFSATSRPYYPDDSKNFGWVNQNWLTHVLFYKIKTAYGGDEFRPQKGEFLIVIYKFVQAILTGLFIYWAARVLGAHPLIAAGTVAFGMLLSRSFIDLRPNVSSILFAAIMMVILAYWKKGRPWAILWMIPVMMLWSNVHGGFIYAIMIFIIMLSANLVQQFFESAEFWPGRFFRPGAVRLKALLAGLIAVVVVPAIFSPFGLENLLHPLMIATGKEGKQWRGVSEWLPIWNWAGFGNATPYLVYISLGGLILLIWWIVFLPKPKPAQSRRRSRKKATSERVPWPKIDLAFLGVMGITLLMSLLSRRFIFLGGVVLAPFLASLLQEIIDMIRLKRRHDQGDPPVLTGMTVKQSVTGGMAAVAATVIVGLVFVLSMNKNYFTDEAKQRGENIFRRMVVVADQPDGAMKFFKRCKFKGIVFNEWTHGGFVAFHQEPDPETGEPPCKVYMDGRAQAAYTLEHYQRWINIRAAMRSDKVDAEMAARLIEGENANVVLVDRHPSKGLQVFEKLKKTKKNKWAPVYYDGRYAIFIKPDNPLNKEPIKIINQIRMEEAIERQRQQKKQPQIQLKKQPKKQPKNLIENKPSN